MTRISTTPERHLAIAQEAAESLPECLGLLQRVVDVLGQDIQLRQRLEAELSEVQGQLQRTRQALRESRAREQSARHSASHDTLTGLPNRRVFDERSTRTLASHEPQAREFGVMYIDLDGFKAINDLHGHAVGDELLKVIGSRLQRAVRAQDAISRQGGDEFLCLLQNVRGEPQVAAIAQKLFDAVSAPCQIGSLSLCVEPSIGIALYPRDATTVEGLLKGADDAMFWAKKRRLGHAFFSQVPAARCGEDEACVLSEPALLS